ncbi:MAG: DUF4198 domain-containing protein [Gammaproteobacteria bacterium]|jgi:cobalt/nickel transport protein|nr:DUF4198 domain-containing protein [Gammaproteobacteria bacterium]
MSKHGLWSVALGIGCLALSSAASAHFQMIIPSDDMVQQGESRDLSLDLMFWHPYEGLGMSMVKPAQFGVVSGGKKTDLLGALKAHRFEDVEGAKHEGFKATYAMKAPGDHIFYVEPKPYWEPTEDAFIVHYTKVVVNGFGMEEGWDEPVGLRTEIMPLTRPYGLYAGNVFQGVVLLDGEPAPGTEVEVEFFAGGELEPEADPMITQVVKADSNGVFTYAMPRAGWWGFAALNTDEENTLKHEGKDYPVELGAVLWVRTHDMK